MIDIMTLIAYFIALLISLIAWIGSFITMVLSTITCAIAGCLKHCDRLFCAMRAYSQRIIDETGL